MIDLKTRDPELAAMRRERAFGYQPLEPRMRRHDARLSPRGRYARSIPDVQPKTETAGSSTCDHHPPE